MYKLLMRLIFIAVLFGVAGCNPSQTTRKPGNTETPELTVTPLSPVEAADTIFFNGVLLTMEKSQPTAEAIALRDGLIQAVGSDQEILSLQGTDTKIVDLHGDTMLPGFIDGHTHILAFPSRKGRSLDEAQETAIRYGFTTVTEMWADPGFLDSLLQAEMQGSLRLRVNVFPSYNDGNLNADHTKVILKTWFPEHDPVLDPTRHLRIPGIKIFMDGDSFSPSRGCWALSEPFMPDSQPLQSGICGTARGDLYWSQEELDQVVLAAQTAGYRVAFHAMGDKAIETAQNAIEYALAGQPNEKYRHQIEHNSLARPDLFPRYKDLDIITSVRGYGDFCNLQEFVPGFGPERYAWYANRYALPGLGIHAFMDIDFGWTIDPVERFSQRTLDPIMQLYGIVTHRYVRGDGSICEPDPLVAAYQISIERALQMLTLEPAYAVSMEDHIGSLKAGKYADLIIISGNPVSVDPSTLKDLEVWMTMINGRVEYCAPGHEAVCHGSVSPENLPSSGNLALNQTVTASKYLQSNLPGMAVDGDENTHWGAGDFMPQWIEVDLGAPAAVSEIRLLTSQSPAGNTQHRILTGKILNELSEVASFDQFTRDHEWLVFKPNQPLDIIRFVRIETISSPSWVSWFEIQVIGSR